MGKPEVSVYNRFVEKYKEMNKYEGMDQYLVPYFMSSHPGCTLEDAVILAEYIRDMGYNPEQVQDFIPTPGSLATAMYYSGYDPRTMEPIYVPRDPHEKAMQRALMQYRNPQNYDLVAEALQRTGREDLIGFGPKCLIKPQKPKTNGKKENRKAANGKGNSKKTAAGKQKVGKYKAAKGKKKK